VSTVRTTKQRCSSSRQLRAIDSLHRFSLRRAVHLLVEHNGFASYATNTPVPASSTHTSPTSLKNLLGSSTSTSPRLSPR
jgi:hypothetical protein